MNSIQFERGTKRTCQDCQARFYDLARTPAICPKCGATYIEIVRPVPTPYQRRKAAFGKSWSNGSPDLPDGGHAETSSEQSKEDGHEEGERELDGEAEPQDEAEDTEE